MTTIPSNYLSIHLIFSIQALGMSVVVTAWNTGLIIGPAVGGELLLYHACLIHLKP